MLPRPRFHFGDFELDVGAFELRLAGAPVRLEKIPLELLILLVEESGQLVTRAEIAERLWGRGVYVDAEQGINTAVRKVRQALGDDPDQPKMVRTVVGKGYRFVAAVTAVRSAQPAAVAPEAALQAGASQPVPRFLRQPVSRLGLAVLVLLAAALLLAGTRVRSWITAAPPVRSIAVIPLENLGDPSQQFFADGITDALITRIAKLRDIRVVSRTSSMHYLGVRRTLPEIARELNVDAVVEGTISRSGTRVRISAQLVDTRREHHLWADEYERDVRDILAVQAEVADNIARAVRTTILEARPTATAIEPVAYDHYLKGRSYWNQRTEEGLAHAIEEFQKALGFQPDYGEALAGLADAYTALGYSSFRAPADTFPFARQAATRALALDPGLGEAEASLAYVSLYFDWDWAAAEGAFKRAIRSNPNYATAHHWYSVFLTAVGRHDEAAAEIRRARDLDPLSIPIATDIGFELYYARRYDDAIAQLTKVLAGNPGFALAHLWLGRCLEAQARFADAVAEFERTDALLKDWPVAIAATGHSLGRANRGREAREALARLQKLRASRYVTPYGVALVHAGLGDRPGALDWLEKAQAERSHWLVWLASDPRFDDLRAEPRFQAILRQMHFPR